MEWIIIVISIYLVVSYFIGLKIASETIMELKEGEEGNQLVLVCISVAVFISPITVPYAIWYGIKSDRE